MVRLNTTIMIKDQPIQLLWIGGWDSTFRLRQSLVEYK